MALSGSTTTTAYNNASLTLSWTATQSATDNTSTVSWTIKGSGSSTSGYHIFIVDAKINGVTLTCTGIPTSSYNGNYKSHKNGKIYGSGTVTISHNSDGTKSFTGYINAAIYAHSINVRSGTSTWTLNSIPRTSTFTLSSTSLSTTETQTITITKANSDFTHMLQWKIESGSWNTLESSSYTGTSKTWDLSTDATTIYNALPSAVSGIITVRMTTYNSGTSIGYVERTFTVTIPASIKPTVSFSLTPNYNNNLNAYVQNVSTVSAIVSGSAGTGSSVSSVTVTFGNQTKTANATGTITSDALTQTGSVSINVTVKDMRNRTTTATAQTITVYAYANPSFTTLTAYRCKSNGDIDLAGGGYIKVTYTLAFSDMGGNNGKSITLKYKKASDSSYTDVYTNQTSPSNPIVFGGGNVDTAEVYDILISITDSVGSTASKSTRVSSAFRLINFNASGHGLAIGGVSIADDFAIYGLPFNTDSNLKIETTVVADRYLKIKNNSHEGVLLATSTGDYGLWSDTANNWLIKYDVNGKGYVEGLQYGYHTGESITLTNLDVAGYVTTNGTDVRFDITLPRHIISGTTLTVSACSGYIRGNLGYLDSTGATSVDYASDSSTYTITATKMDSNRVKLSIVKSSAWGNVTNNTPVVARFTSLTIALS